MKAGVFNDFIVLFPRWLGSGLWRQTGSHGSAPLHIHLHFTVKKKHKKTQAVNVCHTIIQQTESVLLLTLR